LSINGEGASFPNGETASFSFSVVPAPGAMALLGLAGLAARRRRRD
jgi:MYXO-CTERM domain-containing protein